MMPQRVGGVCLLALTVTTGSACAESDDESLAGIRVDTLAGGRVVVSNPDRDPWDDNGGLRLVEELRIGSAVSDGPDAFGDIHSLAVGDAGSIYVADYMAREVRLFEPDGTFVASFGRRGDGPGEFRYGSAVHVVWQRPNRLWAVDPPLLHLVAAGASPRYAAGTPLAESFAGLSFYWKRPRADTAGFAYVGRPARRSAVPNLVVKYAPGETREVVAVDSLHFDQVEQIERPERLFENAFQMIGLPMQPEVVWAVGPGGHLWLANTSEYRLHEVTMAGDTLRTVLLRRAPVPLEGTERDSLAATSGFKEHELPAFRPFFSRVDVAPDGLMWVGVRGRDGGFAWDVFDACGRHQGRVVPETRIGQPFAVAREGRLIGVAKDEMDLEYVVRLALQRPGAATPLSSPC